MVMHLAYSGAQDYKPLNQHREKEMLQISLQLYYAFYHVGV